MSEESEQKTLTGSKIQEERNTGNVKGSEHNQERKKIEITNEIRR